jgi:hypothetical protein
MSTSNYSLATAIKPKAEYKFYIATILLFYSQQKKYGPRPNPSSRTMALGSTQPLTEMSTRNPPGGKGWPASGADNLTTIYELTV